jgi:hypothetical protein
MVDGDRSAHVKGNVIGGVIATGDGNIISINNEKVGNLPIGQSEKEELSALLEKLNGLLEQAPGEKKDEAEAVAVYANNLIEQAGAEKPNKAMLQITAKGMKEAAQGIAVVLPAAEKVVETIVGMVMRMM